MLWTTRPDWVEDSTKWVWTVDMSLELWTWVKNDEKSIEKCTIKKFENIIKKTMHK